MYGSNGRTSTTPEDSGHDDEEADEVGQELVDTEDNTWSQGKLTIQERYRTHIALLREFCDGLDHQIQFADPRMLEALEREGASMLRLAKSCLSREHRLNSTRGGRPGTWERETSTAIFYRSRPAHCVE
jgi:hypothetical protein